MANFGEITNPPNLGSSTGGGDQDECMPKYCCLVEDFEATVFGTFHLDKQGISQPDYLSGDFKYAAYIKCMLETSGTRVNNQGPGQVPQIQKGCRETLGYYDCPWMHPIPWHKSNDGFVFLEMKNTNYDYANDEWCKIKDPYLWSSCGCGDEPFNPGDPFRPCPFTTPTKPGVVWSARAYFNRVSECVKMPQTPCPSCPDPATGNDGMGDAFPVVGLGPTHWSSYYGGDADPGFDVWSNGHCERSFTLTAEELAPGGLVGKSEEVLIKKFGKKHYTNCRTAYPDVDCGSRWSSKVPRGHGHVAMPWAVGEMFPKDGALGLGGAGFQKSWQTVRPENLSKLMKNFADTFCGDSFGSINGLQNCKTTKATKATQECKDSSDDGGDDDIGGVGATPFVNTQCWKCVRVPDPDAPPGHGKTKVVCKKVANRLKEDDPQNGLKKGECPFKTYEKKTDCEKKKRHDCPPPTPPPPA